MTESPRSIPILREILSTAAGIAALPALRRHLQAFEAEAFRQLDESRLRHDRAASRLDSLERRVDAIAMQIDTAAPIFELDVQAINEQIDSLPIAVRQLRRDITNLRGVDLRITSAE